jgi:hypothetical protein
MCFVMKCHSFLYAPLTKCIKWTDNREVLAPLKLQVEFRFKFVIKLHTRSFHTSIIVFRTGKL